MVGEERGEKVNESVFVGGSVNLKDLWGQMQHDWAGEVLAVPIIGKGKGPEKKGEKSS